MNRLKKTTRNILIIIILFVLFLNRTGLYLTPISAHEHSERSAHYGPSEIGHIEDFKNGKHILGRYDKWVSCNTVDKKLFFLWGFGNQVHGFENDLTKAIDFTWGASNDYYKCYGIRNNDNVNKIEITLDNGEVYETTSFYDDLFLITWVAPNNDGLWIRNIKGYGSNGNIIFDEDR